MTRPARRRPRTDDRAAENARLDALLDEALEGTFPASDPVALFVAEPEFAPAPGENGREGDTVRHPALRDAAGSDRSP